MAKSKKAVKKSASKKKAPLKKKALQKPTKKIIAKKTAIKNVKAKTSAKPQMKVASYPVTKAKTQVKWSEFLTPLDDRLIVQMSEQERKTAGGLYIPDTVGDVSGNRQGVAVSVGRGHRDPQGRIRSMDVKLGDRVVFPEYAGSKIELLGETLVLLRESEVMGILTS